MHRPDLRSPTQRARTSPRPLHRVDRVRAPENARDRAHHPSHPAELTAESRMMNWMLPTFASLVLHSHWDRRAVITHVVLAAPALMTPLPALADQASKPSASSMSMDDLLESMATSQSKRTCTSAITCPSEKKKAAALQGSVRSKPSTKNTELSLQPSRATEKHKSKKESSHLVS